MLTRPTPVLSRAPQVSRRHVGQSLVRRFPRRQPGSGQAPHNGSP
jgi:hypothetical protein